MKTVGHPLLIIGAGPTGLAQAQALKDAGIKYEQVEADGEVGGNWHHGTYRTAHIISSRKTTEFSDFPMPPSYPDFPSRRQMADYYKLYADTFGLRERIKFNTKVTVVQPNPADGWDVEFADGTQQTYKGVLLCNGHHWDRRFPDYPGKFTGEFLHSKDFAGPEQLAGKRVLVIGGGNSACDIASEAARVGETCHLSLRRGYWFMPKTILGKPLVESPLMHFPVSIQRILLRLLLRLVVGNYEDYNLPKPDHKIFDRHPTISTEVLHYLRHGRITPRADVSRFDGNIVRFNDGTSEEFDTVICATGFYVSFPFLPQGLVPMKNEQLAMLYGGCLLPDFKHLYILATQQTRYGIGPLLTPATRLVASMIKLQDKMELPLGLVMKESGARLPDTHLVDPIAALRQMKIASYTLPLLLRKEQKLRKKFVSTPNRKDNFTVASNPDLRVY
jgi:Flavin-binding monooxygenase-like